MSFSTIVKGSMIVAGVASLAVAAVGAALFLVEEEPEVEDKPIYEVLPGDTVQWDSGGTFMFPEPKVVERIDKSDMGTYVFVEGSKCGIPITQIIPMS
jgi:hypothetical protein